MAGQIAAAHAPNSHQQHGTHWQRHQHPQKAKQLAKGQQGKNHRQRMQANTLAHQLGRQDKSFQNLPGAKHHQQHQQGVAEAADRDKLQQTGECGQHQTQSKAQIGHKHGQAGKDSNRQGQIQSKGLQTQAVIAGQQQHHQQLPAQVLAQHGIGIPHKAFGGVTQTRRNQLSELPYQTIPFHQQVKQRHRNQHQVADQRKRHAAANLERRQHRAQRIAVIGV